MLDGDARLKAVRYMCDRLCQDRVRIQREKLMKIRAGHQFHQDFARRRELAGVEFLFAHLRFDAVQHGGHGFARHLRRHRFSGIELGAVLDPLPDLRAGNFRRRGIFHQIVDGNAAVSARATKPDTANRRRYSTSARAS